MELVLEREVFSYPVYERRNPFKSLLAGSADGPLFEELTLLGILHSPDPDLSVALLGAGELARGGGDVASSSRTYRVRRGDVLGNIRVLEIRPALVVFDVREFGLSEQKTLELKRPMGGDTR
jgi:hypothetical protein